MNPTIIFFIVGFAIGLIFMYFITKAHTKKKNMFLLFIYAFVFGYILKISIKETETMIPFAIGFLLACLYMGISYLVTTKKLEKLEEEKEICLSSTTQK